MFEGKDVTVLLANAGAGKAGWVEAIIPTPDGKRRFGDLKVGDYVFDREGNPTKVLGVYPRGMMDAYRLTLSDGRSTICGLDHLWTVYRNYYTNKTETLELSAMLEEGIRKSDRRANRKLGKPKFYIPVHGARHYAHKKITVDPYVFGAFTGNGCLTEENLCISSADEETVKKLADKLGFTYKKRSEFNYTWDFFVDGKRVKTTSLFSHCYAHEKYIPDEYKYNDSNVRLSLLQGLFDTDGSAVFDGVSLCASYSTVSKTLCDDVVELLESMGMIASVHKDTHTGRRVLYVVTVNCSNACKANLFTLSRKRNVCLQAGKARRNYSRVAIRSVEKLDSKLEMQCIYVDNEEHLYQCENGIVTHNTSKLMNILMEELKERRPEEIAFVTFTKKGAEEGLSRACNKFNVTPDDLPYFRTLHSLTFHALNLKSNNVFGKIDERKFNKETGYFLNRCENNASVYASKDSKYLDFYDLERSGAVKSKQLMEADIEIGYYRQLVQKYEEYKNQHHLVDFFDCLIKYVQTGDSLPCKVIMCDECQDITALQWQVIDKAFSKAEKIYLAGDENQCIFKYAGARPDYLIKFANKYPRIELKASYRLPKKVYELAKGIVNLIQEKTDKAFEFKEGKEEGNIYSLNELERLKNFLEGVKLDNNKHCQWYLLARNNCYLSKYEKLLEENLIPYWNADGFFMGGEIMRRIKDYKGFALEGYRNEAKREQFRKKYGITDFSVPFYETNLFTEGRKWVYASYIEKYGLQKLEEMCKWNPQILVSTIHYVKGGEADNVAIMLDSTNRTYSEIYEDLDSELRVLYVGVTRAKENLYLIDSSSANGYGKIIKAVKDEYDLDW